MNAELIDTHCHLPGFSGSMELLSVLDRATEAGVSRVIDIGTDLKNSGEALARAQNDSRVFCSVGVYPHHDIDQDISTLESGLAKLIVSSERVVGVGECGFDVSNWEGGRKIEDQRPVFEMQVSLAVKHDLPVIVHNRNADKETLEVLSAYLSSGVRGVAHCFDSGWEIAERFLEMGFYISFSGFITRTSRSHLLDVVKNIPLDRFVLETDSPYILPSGLKGETNEPKNVRIVAEKVAEIKGISLESVAVKSTENARRLFSKIV